MAKPTRTTIQCPRCGNPITAIVESLIDATNDPEAKIRLLNGRLNTVQCPQCGTPSTVATPLLYHDASKELLITYIPMELNMPKDAQEKAIGGLMRELTSSLPQGAMKGYMFQPRQALTMQGLIDQVLQADGVTPEMMEAQRERGRLIQMLVQASDEQLPALIQEHDAKIDADFFRTMTLMAQHMVEQGRPDAAEQIMFIQEQIAGLSSFGQQLMEQAAQQEEIVMQVRDELQALGQGAQRKDFLDLAIKYADDDQRLQALMGLARPVFDYTFFQEMTMRIGQEPAENREKLENLRSRLTELSAMIDQQSQMAVRNAAQLLQIIINSPNPEELLRVNLDAVDETFLAVLSANMQEAQRRSDMATASRLKEIYDLTMHILQDNMQPELKFINELLSAETDEDAQQMLNERAGEYGEGLLNMFDMVSEMIAGRGDQEMLMRLAFLREAAERVLE